MEFPEKRATTVNMIPGPETSWVELEAPVLVVELEVLLNEIGNQYMRDSRTILKHNSRGKQMIPYSLALVVSCSLLEGYYCCHLYHLDAFPGHVLGQSLDGASVASCWVCPASLSPIMSTAICCCFEPRYQKYCAAFARAFRSQIPHSNFNPHSPSPR